MLFSVEQNKAVVDSRLHFAHGVDSVHVNIAKLRPEVNQIFGGKLASSRIMMNDHNCSISYAKELRCRV